MSCANYSFLTRRSNLACSFSESKVYWVLDEESSKSEKTFEKLTQWTLSPRILALFLRLMSRRKI